MKVKRLSIAHNGTTQDGYLMESHETSLLFDPPSKVLDSDVELCGISDRGYIEIEVIKEYPPDITGIFITNSNSLSVFFVESNVTIYLTDYIYLQMKERLKYYVSLGPITRKKHQPQPHTKIVSISEYKEISRRVKIIRHNQVINFTYLSITAQAAGLSLGWIMYAVAQDKEKICAYAYGIPGGSSLAHEMKPSKTPVSLIVNQFLDNKPKNIQDLSKEILALSLKKESFVVTMDILNHSVEMSLHILSLVKARNVYVAHPGFKKIMQLYEMKKDAFADRFMEESSITSTLFSTPRLNAASAHKISRALKEESIIILCEPSLYQLFFKNLPVIHLSDYCIKFIGNMEDALKLPWVEKLYVNPIARNHNLEKKYDLPVEDTSKDGICVSEDKLYSIKIHNTHNIHVVSRSKDSLTLHFSGDFNENISGLSLDCKESKLQKILSHTIANRSVVNDTLVCDIDDKVFKIKEEGGVVQVRKEKPTSK
ncbi:hypothetical protein NEPAR04_0440 [Nematocida parisii]|nr:hypothetical protein NEPAR03_0472 [Nematocida parisii]KAI5126470.1 hypothetical protein NEPAR08_0461 [Nematocida parisii]KAI5140705.1 hypothetical protein NEPAR04_0440 [Nematocida parisii]